MQNAKFKMQKYGSFGLCIVCICILKYEFQRDEHA